jgi:hypothetical protein
MGRHEVFTRLANRSAAGRENLWSGRYALSGMFPSRGVWRRPGLRPVDLLVFAALLALLFGLLRLAPGAVRSLLRMFIGLILSVLFTFVYATAAARLRRAEKVPNAPAARAGPAGAGRRLAHPARGRDRGAARQVRFW